MTARKRSGGRFLRRTKVRRRRDGLIKRSARWVLGGAVLTGLGFAALELRDRVLVSERFEVRTVGVEGVRYDALDEIRALCEPNVGENLFRVDVRGLSARLRERPWVRSVRVARRPPDEIRVRIVERHPAALVQTPRGALELVDGDGRRIVPAPDELAQSAPVIVGIEPDEVGRAARVRRGLAVLDALAQTSRELVDNVSRVDLGRRDRIRLEMRDGAPEVYLRADAPERNLSRYAMLRGWLTRNHADADYVDLRWRGRLVVGPRG